MMDNNTELEPEEMGAIVAAGIEQLMQDKEELIKENKLAVETANAMREVLQEVELKIERLVVCLQNYVNEDCEMGELYKDAKEILKGFKL